MDWVVGSCLTGGGEGCHVTWVEDGQKCRRGLGFCGRAGGADAEVRSWSQSRRFGPKAPQADLLWPQGGRNCFLGVRNKGRFDMDFNLGT